MKSLKITILFIGYCTASGLYASQQQQQVVNLNNLKTHQINSSAKQTAAIAPSSSSSSSSSAAAASSNSSSSSSSAAAVAAVAAASAQPRVYSHGTSSSSSSSSANVLQAASAAKTVVDEDQLGIAHGIEQDFCSHNNPPCERFNNEEICSVHLFLDVYGSYSLKEECEKILFSKKQYLEDKIFKMVKIFATQYHLLVGISIRFRSLPSRSLIYQYDDIDVKKFTA